KDKKNADAKTNPNRRIAQKRNSDAKRFATTHI
ncbi:MAG: hypothetical protein RLZZ324_1305, partial [Candidatus Parcubacteria bacterium]